MEGLRHTGKWLILKKMALVETIDASGRIVLPAFCDSHTHLVYAAPRQTEFVDRINGLSYEEIANRGGGILNSAKKMRETSEEQLVENATRQAG